MSNEGAKFILGLVDGVAGGVPAGLGAADLLDWDPSPVVEEFMASGDDLTGTVLLIASALLFMLPKRLGVDGLAGKSDVELGLGAIGANKEGDAAAAVAGMADPAAGALLFAGACGLLELEESAVLAPNKLAGVDGAGLGVWSPPNKDSLLLASFGG